MNHPRRNRPFRLYGLAFEPVERARAYQAELQDADANLYANGLLVVLAREAPEDPTVEDAIREASEDIAGAQMLVAN